MKTGKLTAASLVLAAVLVAGMAAFFATSAKDEPAGTGIAAWRAVAVETAVGGVSGAAVITKEQFRDMAQRHMEARSVPG